MDIKLLNDAKLTVDLFDGTTKNTIIVRSSTSGAQIGQSYQVEATLSPLWQDEQSPVVSPEVTKYFLKIPSPSTDVEGRDAVRERVEREAERERELNELISTIRSANQRNPAKYQFDLPQLIQAGVITKVDHPEDFSQFVGLPFVIYEWREGIPLNRLASDSPKEFKKIRSEWLHFTEGLAEVVRRLHNHGFFHAYIVPRNILFDSAKASFSLAGFGYSSLSIEEARRPREMMPVDMPYQAPEFNIERGLDALWYLSDIFSIGTVLFYLSTGQAPELYAENRNFSKKDVVQLKAYVRQALEPQPKPSASLEHREKDGSGGQTAVISVHDEPIPNIDNAAKIIDNCIRFDPDDRFETVEDLIAAIEIAKAETPKPRKKNGDIVVGSIFQGIYLQKKAEFKAVKSRIKKRHHYEIYGSRTKIIEGLCRIVGSMEKGAVYSTVTLPSYWTQNNLGPDGRFLAMNKHAAKEGVIIRRIFLVSGLFHTLSDEEQAILKSQRAAVHSLPEDAKTRLEVKVRVVPDELILNFERSGQSVAFISAASDRGEERRIEDIAFEKDKVYGQFLSLNFISRGEQKRRFGKDVIERTIKKVRIWDPGRSSVYWKRLQDESKEFAKMRSQSSIYTLDRYIDGVSGPTLESLLREGVRRAS